MRLKDLCAAAVSIGRHGYRDRCMVLIAYRHGLRVSELVSLRWDQVNLDDSTIYIRRCKGSKSGSHPLERDEANALRKLGSDRSGVVFKSERGGPISASAFFKVIARAGVEANLGFPTHPHSLRHACGYSLASRDVPTRLIQEWLGHRQIANTVRYTEIHPDRWRKENLWSRRKPN